MNCERARDLIGAYRDGELSADEHREVAAHVASCRDCHDTLADDERIGRAVRGMGRVAVPADLPAGVITALADASRRLPLAGRPLSHSQSRPAGRTRRPPWGRTAAAAAAACVLSIASTWWVMSSSAQADRIGRDILSAHIRSLVQDTPVQVASSDQHTVRPWFAGRIDFAPLVKDLVAEGFPLLGGRLDYVDDRRVGVIVYKRKLHIINVFLWPATDALEALPSATSRNGYNLLSWRRNGISYWAISDLNATELAQLQRLL
jgi:anti-sigma factor RsiW